MATKRTITATPQAEASSMFIVLNQTNAYAPEHSLRFATEAEAEAKAREMLNANPGHVVVTAKLLNTFKATVTIDSSPVETAPAE